MTPGQNRSSQEENLQSRENINEQSNQPLQVAHQDDDDMTAQESDLQTEESDTGDDQE